MKKIGRAAVFVIGADRRGLKRLTPWKLDAASPDWSPDGSTLVFNSHFDAGPKQSANLYTMRPDGSRRIPLTHHHGGRVHSFRPSWAPDGTRIVFARFTPRGRNGRTRTAAASDASPTSPGASRCTPDWGQKPSLPVGPGDPR